VTRRHRFDGLPPLLAIIAAGAAYLVSMAAAVSGTSGTAVLLLGTAVAAAALLSARDRGEPAIALAAWIPVHLLVASTGSLDSPLLPLVGGWVVLIVWRTSIHAIAAVSAPLVLTSAVHMALHGAPPGGRLVELALLLLLGGAAAGMLRVRTSAAGGDSPARTQRAASAPDRGVQAGRTGAEPGLIDDFLELSRRATDAHEAALWRVDRDASSAHLAGYAGNPDQPRPEAPASLAGHPFSWALEEGMHLCIEPGRRRLPSPWAEQMLVIPLDQGMVLSLAYAAATPPGAEPAAVAAGRVMAELLDLCRIRDVSADRLSRTRALQETIQTFRGDVDLSSVVEVLARTVREQTGAEGVCVAVCDDDGDAELVLVQGEAGHGLLRGDSIGEASSRLALAMKHQTLLVCADVPRESDGLPLVRPGEHWSRVPRSAIAAPIATAADVVGGVVVWHSGADRFTEEHEEYVDLLCTVAAAPLRSVRRYEDLDRRASSDALTGLPNRRAFEARLASTAHLLERYGRPFSLVILDVDHFKKFNDTWGHEAGDRVLQHIAELLRGSVREVDLPARLGGEEFVVLLPETELLEAVDAAERIRRSVEARPVYWQGRPLRVTASFGAAACPGCCSAPSDILSVADAALYRAKEDGRNRVVPAAPLPAAS
jgi:diguanylate cyclase (GGDEF)-like protein